MWSANPTPHRESLNSLLGLTEKRKTKASDRNADEEGQQRICDSKIPNQTNSIGDNLTGFSEQASNSDSSFSRENSSFKLVELIALGAGAGIEPAAPDHETGMLPLHHPAICIT